MLSVKVVSVTIRLNLTSKIAKLYTIMESSPKEDGRRNNFIKPFGP